MEGRMGGRRLRGSIAAAASRALPGRLWFPSAHVCLVVQRYSVAATAREIIDALPRQVSAATACCCPDPGCRIAQGETRQAGKRPDQVGRHVRSAALFFFLLSF